MSCDANEDGLCCTICEVTYATANSVFVLSCAKDGCMGHLCFDCLQKACFSGTRSSQDPPACPHCRRQVSSYSYAVFQAIKNVDALQTKIETSSAEVTRLTKNLATAKAQADESSQRLKDWCQWATATKSVIQGMPSSAMPPHVRPLGPLPSGQADSDAARSRSPRQVVRPAGVMYGDSYTEYTG